MIFLEHKRLCTFTGPVPEEGYIVPIGEASLKKTGDDVTIVATALMVQKALSAADKVSKGINVEIIVPRTIRPLDKKPLLIL